MPNSNFWVTYSALVYTKSLMQELVDAGTLDLVTLDPTTPEFQTREKVVMLQTEDDSADFGDSLPADIMIEGAISLFIWGGKSLTEDALLAQERLVATIRDKIHSAINAGGYLNLDPPVQVEGLSVSEETAVARERETAGTVITLEIKNHG